MRLAVLLLVLFVAPCFAQELAPVHEVVYGYVYSIDQHEDGESIASFTLCDKDPDTISNPTCLDFSTEGSNYIAGIDKVNEGDWIVVRVTAYVRPDGEIEIFAERVWTPQQYFGNLKWR